jgi:hypothetical protein
MIKVQPDPLTSTARHAAPERSHKPVARRPPPGERATTRLSPQAVARNSFAIELSFAPVTLMPKVDGQTYGDSALKQLPLASRQIILRG